MNDQNPPGNPAGASLMAGLQPPHAEALAPGQPMVMVGTPAYGGMVHTDFVHSLFGFASAGIRFELYTLGNESLITRARNQVLSTFHEQTRFTHLLFLDADVHLPADGLARMLAADVPVIGAPVALKAHTPDGRNIWNITRRRGSAGPLICVDHIGTAALLFSRAAVNALVDDAIEAGRVYQRHSNQRGDVVAALQYDVFRTGVSEGEYLSEDFWVCRRLWELGFAVCMEPTVVTRHHGVMAA